MRTTRLILPAVVLLAVAGLAWGQTMYGNTNAAPRYAGAKIVTELTGDQVVGSVAIRAFGKVYFDVRSDGTLHYKVQTTGTDNITGVYINQGGNGQVGPVVARLFAPDQPTGLIRGTIVEGTLTDADLVGPLAGQGVGALVDWLMDNDKVHVNITTTDHPQGELRGNIPYPYR